ncbi:hypothetical protein ACX3YG_18745 [Pseudomonas wadenswilerensis]
MRSLESVAAEMRSSGSELVVALQTNKEIKQQSFEHFDRASRELAQLLRGSEQLPRQIVNDLYIIAKTLENEAPHSIDSEQVLKMAYALYMTFDLILLGESHEDRQPGVPRIS